MGAQRSVRGERRGRAVHGEKLPHDHALSRGQRLHEGERGVGPTLRLGGRRVRGGVSDELEVRLPPPGGDVDGLPRGAKVGVHGAPGLLAVHQQVDAVASARGAALRGEPLVTQPQHHGVQRHRLPGDVAGRVGEREALRGGVGEAGGEAPGEAAPIEVEMGCEGAVRRGRERHHEAPGGLKLDLADPWLGACRRRDRHPVEGDGERGIGRGKGLGPEVEEVELEHRRGRRGEHHVGGDRGVDWRRAVEGDGAVGGHRAVGADGAVGSDGAVTGDRAVAGGDARVIGVGGGDGDVIRRGSAGGEAREREERQDSGQR